MSHEQLHLIDLIKSMWIYKMVSTGQALISSEISSCLLTHKDHIMKIPEPQKVSIQNYHQLPCAEDYSIVSIYNDLFKNTWHPFDEEKLINKVLSHIRNTGDITKGQCRSIYSAKN